ILMILAHESDQGAPLPKPCTLSFLAHASHSLRPPTLRIHNQHKLRHPLREAVTPSTPPPLYTSLPTSLHPLYPSEAIHYRPSHPAAFSFQPSVRDLVRFRYCMVVAIQDQIRERVVALAARGTLEPSEIQDLLGIKKTAYYKILATEEATGSSSRPEVTSVLGRPRNITTEELDYICALYKDYPDLYLDEVRYYLGQVFGTYHPISTLHRAIEELKLTRKKLKIVARQRDEEERALFDALKAQWFGRECVWTDETARAAEEDHRKFGRSREGVPAIMQEPLTYATLLSVLPAISLDGVIACRVFEGAVDALGFFEFCRDDLIPNLKPHHKRVIMDNCPSHMPELLQPLFDAFGEFALSKACD
ncbi:hypothetical protein P7C70_g9364, partial [Phenoliferia sp. Uapishka_3]